MLSFLKNLWDSMDAEKQKRIYAGKLEDEQRHLDAEIEKEEIEKHKNGDASGMQNILASVNRTQNDNKKNENEDKCFERFGKLQNFIWW